jgi:hypothetical protein
VAVWYSGGADAEYGSSTDVFGCTSFVAIDKLFLSSFSSSFEETTSSSEAAMTTELLPNFNTLFPVLDKSTEISDDDFLRLLRSCCCFEKNRKEEEEEERVVVVVVVVLLLVVVETDEGAVNPAPPPNDTRNDIWSGK